MYCYVADFIDVEKIFPDRRWHYSASWRAGRIQIWRIDISKTWIFTVSGSLFVDLNIQTYYKKTKKQAQHIFETSSFSLEFCNWEIWFWLKFGDLVILDLFKLWTFENGSVFDLWKVETLTSLIFETSGLWNSRNLKLWNCET